MEWLGKVEHDHRKTFQMTKVRQAAEEISKNVLHTQRENRRENKGDRYYRKYNESPKG